MVNNSNHIQANRVLWTTELNSFILMEGNRKVNPKHVERIELSINKHGVLMNPIIVNSKFEVIDGQHRLEAARNSSTGVYYIVAPDYKLSEVHTLNLNQKNWGTKDYLDGYVNLGIKQYISLNNFMFQNPEFSIAIAISICSESIALRSGRNLSTDFSSGNWVAIDFKEAQGIADKLKLIGAIYDGYTRRNFVKTMLELFENDKFDFNEFTHKLRLQPTALVDCVNVMQYKTLIEDIYNWRNRNKVSFKY